MPSINLYSNRVHPRRVFPVNNFLAGMSRYDKDNSSGAFAFARAADYRSNPREITIQPASVKESAGVTQGLPTWMEHINATGYIFDNKGNIYSRTGAGSHTLLHTAPDSQGNGLAYYGADDYLYFINNKAFGRYGPISSSPQFVDNYLASQGGVPTNTYSLSLIAASSQYAKHADAAAFDITSDLAMEIYVYPNSLPAASSSMTLMGKWDESTNHRSYKFDIYGVAGYSGDGTDGALTISSDLVEVPIDSACTGTAGQYTLSATNVSFAAGQIVLIHQTQGTNAGQYELGTIQAYSAGTITLANKLTGTYVSGAQVRVMKRYTNVTINSGINYYAKAWNGTTGGILAFFANGTVTVTGNISASARGFRGGNAGSAWTLNSYQGEGTLGVGVQQGQAGATGGYAPNGNGGGAGGSIADAYSGGGGGGGNGTAGTDANHVAGKDWGNGAGVAGAADLTTMVFGGGGGGANHVSTPPNGGNGGGAIFINAATLTVTGTIVANGAGTAFSTYSPGSGAGGSILLKVQTATLGTGLITANGDTTNPYGQGGAGRVVINYYTSYTGTSSPTLNPISDNTLTNTTTYQLRLGISNDGTAFEYLTKNINITTGSWQGKVGVSWKASTSIATFYQSGLNIGTTTGTKTSINNNVSEFAVGSNKGGAAYQNFFDGLLDDAALWNTTRSDAQMLAGMGVQYGGNETGLAAYYKFNNSLNDATAAANNLSNINTATFSINVSFAGLTTRLDIDQQNIASQVGTYTVPASLTEADQMAFVPAKDPQKSIDVDIAAIGTGNWTLIVHNGLNQQVASAAVTNANLHTGFYEFLFSSVFTPVVGATYHFHLYSTVGDGTVNTHVNADPTSIRFHSYYQFLANTPYHPVLQVVNVLGIGNGRYLATWDAAAGFNPMRLSFPPQWNVRCIAKWRNMFAIGCWKGTNISDFDQGIIFFWDGYSITYNDFIEVPHGGINAMVGKGDKLFFIAGYNGRLMYYDGSTELKTTRKIPKIDRTTRLEVLPGAMCAWDGKIRIGIALSSNNANIQRGIYTFGSNFSDEEDSFSFDHIISTGNYGSTVQVGALMPMNGSLLVGWQDGIANGVDAIDPTGNPSPAATVEGLVMDFGFRWKEKVGLTARADFKPLKAGESVTVKYRFGYGNPWVLADLTKQGKDGKTAQTTGQTYVRLPIPTIAGDSRYHEFQIGVDLAQTNNTAPTVLEYGIDTDLMITETEGAGIY